ncbi:hypothetical protein [Nocardioides pantholopis]|uniref:hypothetical protein n=1 Tax=Nocardioides pantholopis TaxID=2483798 RepID=UPI000F076FB2|nr:hypothetical protein [Nocardioides pantholopis]
MSALLIDTNVWSYLAEETTPDAVAMLLKRTGHQAVLNSMMLTEGLRTCDVAKRTAIVNMMASPHWRKLPADGEAMELVEEVRRLRPEWLRSIPKTDRLHSFRDYWTKVYWRDAKTQPDKVLERLAQATAEDDAEAEIARVQAANKASWPFLEGDLKSAALAANTAEDHPDSDPRSRLGWPTDTPVLLWRVNARDVMWATLGREAAGRLIGYSDKTLEDSLGAYVDLKAMRKDRGSFNRFFLFDIEGWNVPRCWWRGTVEILQLGKRLQNSNGMDAAHASHLPDCDYLLTTDKRFHDIVKVASETLGAPRGGAVVLVEEHPGGWLDALEHALANLPPKRQPTPTRIIGVGAGARVGNGPGEVSAAQVHRETKHGPKVKTYEGPARLLDADRKLVAERVQVFITNRPEMRPEGVRSKYFGALRVLPTTDGDEESAPVTASIAYVLEWRGVGVVDGTDIWVRAVADGGAFASFSVNGKF